MFVTSPKEVAVAHKLKFEWSIPVKDKASKVKVILDGKTIAVLTDLTVAQSMKLKRGGDGTFEPGEVNGFIAGDIVKANLEYFKKNNHE
jgi:hypothetical protein